MLRAEQPITQQHEHELPRAIFDYEVLDFIGEGAGSIIYVVVHPQSRQLYALKHVVIRREKDYRFIEQLDNEYQVSQKFAHPALRRSIDRRDNHTLFRRATEAALIMELFDGLTLESCRARDIVELADIFIQVAEGLCSLHSLGYVHCDLKPSNIMVSVDNQVKIVDFGQACRLGSVKERIQGTPDYISPEQVKCEPVTVRTDVFNLGATMYWALAGRTIPTLYTVSKGKNSFLLDQRIDSPRDISSLVPEPLSALVMECIRTNSAKRPEDMSQLSRRLEVVRHAITRRTSAVA